jgi:glycosyltransferase involved in cell wall biosynthesis
VGDITPDKGIFDLIDAATSAQEALEAENVKLLLDVFGAIKPAYSTEFLHKIEAHKDLVRYRGYAPHKTLIPQLLNYDALVLPTHYRNEGHPGVLIEAMALGIPVISSNYLSIPEVITNGYDGMLFDITDNKSLAQQIIVLALDDALREKLSTNAQNSSMRFDTATVLPKLCELAGI